MIPLKKREKLNTLSDFEKEILELFETKKEAFNAQEKYIKKFNTVIPNGYNMDPHGGMGVLDSPLPENIRKKISRGNQGRTSPNKGKKLSKKHRIKIG